MSINFRYYGVTRMDYATEQLLRYVAFGHIPHGFKSWTGFQFGRDGLLYPRNSPFGYSAGEIQVYYMIMGQAGEVPGLRKEALLGKDTEVEG